MKKFTVSLLFPFCLLMGILSACTKSTPPTPPAPSPKITSISPTTGAAGTVVTITGSDFSATATSNTVKFNGTDATVTSATVNQLVVTTPAGGSSGAITVTTPDGSVTGPSFTYTAVTVAPTISAIAPVAGSAGDTVTITGTHFDIVAGNNAVSFHAVPATVLTASATQIKAIVPASGTTGAVSVTVTGNTATGPVFTYLAKHDVYVLGSTAAGFCYWKNGVRTDLPADAQLLNSSVNTIYVSGSDVLVGGSTGTAGAYYPVYWKNGTSINLPNNGIQGTVLSIASSGTDIFAVGYYYNSANKYPKAWKNEVDYPLTASSNLTAGLATSVAVSGGQVYISGTQNNGFDATFKATIWQNGAPTLFTDGSIVTSLFLSGASDVYAAGLNNGVPVYWKNQTSTPLAPGSSSPGNLSIGRNIFVLGSDVYVVGQANGSAKYWKNAALVGLSVQEFDGSVATCIHGTGNDFYIGGESDGVNSIWGYWEDGIFVAIPDCTHVYDIFVK